MKPTEITIGADPEYFVKKSGRYTVAEHTGIKGTKSNPSPLPHGGAVQIDGCALEFNIKPALTATEFDRNIEDTLSDIRSLVDPSFEFVFKPAVTFSKTEWEKASKVSKILGCDPDYDAYTQKAKTPPPGSEEAPFRTASGHLHVGFTEPVDPQDPAHIFDCAVITQFIDLKLGMYQKYWDGDQTRRRIYGDFGSFRPKPYGLEYRVLSNQWVTDRPLRRFIFQFLKNSIGKLLQGKDAFQYPVNRSSVSDQWASLPQLAANASQYGVIPELRQAWNSGSFSQATPYEQNWMVHRLQLYQN